MNIHYGDWTIVRKIGSGSFGTVYEIERESFGFRQKAALKVISIPQSQNDVASIRNTGMDEASIADYYRDLASEIVKELQTMNQLKGHTNIVSYEDHEIRPRVEGIGWEIYIRMELLMPLQTYLSEHQMNRNEILRLGIDLCRALERCESLNIIHRDIKPDNIFLSNQGDGKLGDFGIARTVERTMPGMSRKGTFSFMAPEVYKGQPYGKTVDIYSLGLVLYRLLNYNRGPFLPPYPTPIKYQDQSQALARRIQGEALSAPAQADPRLAEVVLKACNYHPKERYSRPREMRTELETILLDSKNPGSALGPITTSNSFATLILKPKPEQTLKKNSDDVYEGGRGREKTPGAFGGSESNNEQENGKVGETVADGRESADDKSADKFYYGNCSSDSHTESSTIELFERQRPEDEGTIPFFSSIEKNIHESEEDSIVWRRKEQDGEKTEPFLENKQRGQSPERPEQHGNNRLSLSIVLAVCLVIALVIGIVYINYAGTEVWAEESETEQVDENKEDDRNAPDSVSEKPRDMESKEALAAQVIDSGSCGDNLTWSLDESGALTISGEGKMRDDYVGDRPWETYISQIKSVVIQDGVTNIGQYAFHYCSLTNITIPSSVTSIGKYAFSNCDSLTSITIPSSVTSVGKHAFEYCSSLTSITISSGVTSIGQYAFWDCSSLTSITIPSSVTSIYKHAFSGCSSLTSITISSGVTSIGDYAFEYCDQLKRIVFKGNAPTIGDISFIGVTATAYYPADNKTWTKEKKMQYGGNIEWIEIKAALS